MTAEQGHLVRVGQSLVSSASVPQRFAWAASAGHKALPDNGSTKGRRMTPPPNVHAVKNLATICCASLPFDQATKELPESTDWETLWDLAESEGVEAWCFDFATRRPETISTERIEEWRQGYITQVICNREALKQLAEVVRVFEAESIRIIVLAPHCCCGSTTIQASEA